MKYKLTGRKSTTVQQRLPLCVIPNETEILLNSSANDQGEID